MIINPVRRAALSFAFGWCALFQSERVPLEAAPPTAEDHQDSHDRSPAVRSSSGTLGAIVRIVDASIWPGAPNSPRGLVCSGSLVGPHWVLTAWHCLRIRVPAVVLSDGHGDTLASVVRVVAHPSADVALLRIEPPVAGTPASAAAKTRELPSLELATPTEAHPGDDVRIAGYGLTLEGADVGLRVRSRKVLASDASTLTVGGTTGEGACQGDSGGPLLASTADGDLRVAGVLSYGSSNCMGKDTYVRLDTIRDWLAANMREQQIASGCGATSAQGRCLYANAMWCSARAEERHPFVDACLPRATTSVWVPLNDLASGTSSSNLPPWAAPCD
jgi:hypothetical protein